MEVRVATKNDVEPLCTLLTEFFAYNANLQPMYCNAAIEDGKYPTSIIESDDSDFIIAVSGGKLIGFIHIVKMETPPYNSIVPYNYAEIIAFMVTASFREQGVGTRLLDFAKLWSKDQNLEYIELVSLINATEANLFYDKNKFSTMSQVKRLEL